MTSSARWGCICCGAVGSRPDVLPNQTSPKTQPCGEEICESRLSSSDHYQDRLPVAVFLGGGTERSSTTFANSHPKSRCTPSLRIPMSANQFQGSARQRELICFLKADRGQELEVPRRRRSFAFFPPREYSPSLTFVLVSTEISSVCESV